MENLKSKYKFKPAIYNLLYQKNDFFSSTLSEKVSLLTHIRNQKNILNFQKNIDKGLQSLYNMVVLQW